MACITKAWVEDKSTGKMVESKLWNDLLSVTSYKEAKKYYKIATTDIEWREEWGESIKYDKYDEPTLSSLMEYTDLESKVNIKDVLKRLNKELGSGKYEFDEALDRVSLFNKNNIYPEKYEAVIKKGKRNKYIISVIDKNPNEYLKSVNLVHQERKRNRLIKLLNDNGVAVKIEDLHDTFDSQYSTIDPTQTAEGLYELIKLCSRNSDNYSLATAAGHFIVGGLGENHPLLQRLFSKLDEKTQRKLLGDNYSKIEGSQRRLREAAGILIGKELANELDIKHKPLVKRIIEAFQKLLSNITFHKLDFILNEPMIIADNIVRGFLSSNWEGNVNNALEYSENVLATPNVDIANDVKYQNSIYNTNKSIHEVYSALKEYVLDVSTISEKYHKAVVKDMEKIDSLYTKRAVGHIGTDFADTQLYMQALVETVVKMIDSADDIFREDNGMLARIVKARNENALDYSLNSYKYAKDLRTVCAYLTLLQSINKNIETLIEHTNNPELNAILESAKSKITNIKKANDIVEDEVKYMALNFMTRIYGKSTVKLINRKLFKSSRQAALNMYIKENPEISLEQAIFNPNENDKMLGILQDINFWEEWFSMAHNTPSICNQLLHKACMEANAVANAAALDYKTRIETIKEDFDKNIKSKYGIVESDLYETIDGKKTGNFLSKFNYAKWEQAKNDKINDFKNEFNKTWAKQVGTYEYKAAIDIYIKTRMRAWHKSNSIYDSESKKFIPNHLYENETYTKLNTKTEGNLERILDNLLKLKEEAESTVSPYGITTHKYRAPQYRSSYRNAAENRRLHSNVLLSEMATFRDWVRNLFLIEETDTENGTPIYDDSENYKYYAPGSRLKNAWYDKNRGNTLKTYRLPLHGINRVKNTDWLSTDIFANMIRYTTEICNYSAQERILDSLEIGKQALSNKHKKLEKSSKGREVDSYERYMKYMFFRETMPAINIRDSDVAWEKVLKHLRNVTVFALLGFKLPAMIVNMVSNITRRAALAYSQNNHSLSSDMKARMEYFKNWGDQNIINWGKTNKKDFHSKLLRRFNMRDSMTTEASNISYRTTKATKVLKELPYLGFSADDQHHQSLELIQTMLETPVFIKEEGKSILIETNLYDIYKEQHENNPKSEFELPNNLYVYSSGLEDEEFIDSIYKKLKSDNLFDSVDDNDLNKLEELFNKYKKYVKGKTTYDIKSAAVRMDLMVKLLEELKYSIKVHEQVESKITQVAQKNYDMIFGAYRSSTLTAFQRDPLFRTTTGMKGYKYGYFNTYFGMRNSTDIVADQDMEAWYKSWFKIIVDPLKTDTGVENLNVLDSFLISIIPFTSRIGYLRNKAKRSGFTDNQLNNAFGVKSLFLAGLFLKYVISSAISGYWGPGDDEEEDKIEKPVKIVNPLIASILKDIEEVKNMQKKLGNLDKEYIKDIYKEAGITPPKSEPLPKEKKKPKNLIAGWIHYATLGASSELLGFAYPANLLNEWKSFAAPEVTGMTYYFSLANIIAQLITYSCVDVDEDNSWIYYQKDGLFYDAGDPKFKNQAIKKVPILNNRDFIFDPWNTAGSRMFWQNLAK